MDNGGDRNPVNENELVHAIHAGEQAGGGIHDQEAENAQPNLVNNQEHQAFNENQLVDAGEQEQFNMENQANQIGENPQIHFAGVDGAGIHQIELGEQHVVDDVHQQLPAADQLQELPQADQDIFNDRERLGELVRTNMDRCDGICPVVEKELTRSDVSRHYNRLTLPLSKLSDEFVPFLTDEEMILLEEEEGDIKALFLMLNGRGEQPFIIQEEEAYIRLTRRCNIWVLNEGGWTQALIDHGLQAGMEVSVWAFRVNGRPDGTLGFLFVLEL